MKKKIIIISCFISIFLIVFGCINKIKGSESKKAIFDQTSNWILLDKKDAVKTGTVYSWEFEKGNPIEYVVQVVFEKDFPKNAKSAIITMDDQEAVDALNESYKTYNGHLIAEFKKTIKFIKTGKHNFTIDTNTDFKQIRIVPYYKNPLGSGQYHEQWLKMHQSPEKQAALKWFKEAKFGMFIHWGLYSQAGGMWKETKINDSPFEGPKVAEWLMHAFQIPRTEYAALTKTFNPDKSFAQNIAKLAKKAGMKYVVITSKHHDGFALFNSKVSDYDMVDATPYKADAVKELYDACLSEGLDFGVYYSHGNDWNDGGDGNYSIVKKVNDSLGVFTHDSGKNLWDPSPNSHAAYLKAKALPQIKELITLLPKLRLIWFDGEGLINEDQSFQFYKLVYDANPSILVNRRVGWDFGDYLDAGDNKIPSADEAINKYWETCGTTNNSWGYKIYDQDWKSSQELLYYFVDILSKGGNYLLNIGPDGKGHVPEASASGLIEMGEWIAINKKAVYGTSRWKVANEGQEETLLDGTGHRESKGFKRTFNATDFWFTTNGDKIYAISLVKASGSILIHAFKNEIGKIKAVKILGSDKNVKWNQSVTGLEINLEGIDSNKNGFVVEVSL